MYDFFIGVSATFRHAQACSSFHVPGEAREHRSPTIAVTRCSPAAAVSHETAYSAVFIVLTNRSRSMIIDFPRSAPDRRTGHLSANLPHLNRLRAFEAVARLGSLSLAGAELSVSGSAVGRQIKELESELGVPVMERDGRGIRLTDEGRDLFAHLEPAFDIISSAFEHARRDPGRSRLTVRTPPVFATTWLFHRLPRFYERAPDVDLVVTDLNFEELPSARAADVMIDYGDFSEDTNDIAEKLTDEAVFPVCVPSMCPKDGDLSRLTLLHRHSFPSRYGFPDWPSFLDLVGREVPDTNAGPRVAGGLILDAARTGNGAALAIWTIARDDLKSGRLVRPIPERRGDQARLLASAHPHCAGEARGEEVLRLAARGTGRGTERGGLPSSHARPLPVTPTFSDPDG